MRNGVGLMPKKREKKSVGTYGVMIKGVIRSRTGPDRTEDRIRAEA